MTIEQGLLTDREYIILLEAKIRMLERQCRYRQAMERLGWIPRDYIRRQGGMDQCD
jgi:hypothetical protein